MSLKNLAFCPKNSENIFESFSSFRIIITVHNTFAYSNLLTTFDTVVYSIQFSFTVYTVSLIRGRILDYKRCLTVSLAFISVLRCLLISRAQSTTVNTITVYSILRCIIILYAQNFRISEHNLRVQYFTSIQADWFLLKEKEEIIKWNSKTRRHNWREHCNRWPTWPSLRFDCLQNSIGRCTLDPHLRWALDALQKALLRWALNKWTVPQFIKSQYVGSSSYQWLPKNELYGSTHDYRYTFVNV